MSCITTDTDKKAYEEHLKKLKNKKNAVAKRPLKTEVKSDIKQTVTSVKRADAKIDENKIRKLMEQDYGHIKDKKPYKPIGLGHTTTSQQNKVVPGTLNTRLGEPCRQVKIVQGTVPLMSLAVCPSAPRLQNFNVCLNTATGAAGPSNLPSQFSNSSKNIRVPSNIKNSATTANSLNKLQKVDAANSENRAYKTGHQPVKIEYNSPEAPIKQEVPLQTIISVKPSCNSAAVASKLPDQPVNQHNQVLDPVNKIKEASKKEKLPCLLDLYVPPKLAATSQSVTTAVRLSSKVSQQKHLEVSKVGNLTKTKKPGEDPAPYSAKPPLKQEVPVQIRGSPKPIGGLNPVISKLPNQTANQQQQDSHPLNEIKQAQKKEKTHCLLDLNRVSKLVTTSQSVSTTVESDSKALQKKQHNLSKIGNSSKPKISLEDSAVYSRAYVEHLKKLKGRSLVGKALVQAKIPKQEPQVTTSEKQPLVKTAGVSLDQQLPCAATSQEENDGPLRDQAPKNKSPNVRLPFKPSLASTVSPKISTIIGRSGEQAAVASSCATAGLSSPNLKLMSSAGGAKPFHQTPKPVMASNELPCPPSKPAMSGAKICPIIGNSVIPKVLGAGMANVAQIRGTSPKASHNIIPVISADSTRNDSQQHGILPLRNSTDEIQTIVSKRTDERPRKNNNRIPVASDFFDEPKPTIKLVSPLKGILKRPSNSASDQSLPCKMQITDGASLHQGKFAEILKKKVRPELSNVEVDCITVIPSINQTDGEDMLAGMSIDNAIAAGLEFIHPVSGYHCVLCRTFYHDYPTALHHCAQLNHKMKVVKGLNAKK